MFLAPTGLGDHRDHLPPPSPNSTKIFASSRRGWGVGVEVRGVGDETCVAAGYLGHSIFKRAVY